MFSFNYVFHHFFSFNFNFHLIIHLIIIIYSQYFYYLQSEDLNFLNFYFNLSYYSIYHQNFL